jgi:ABC-2 type transport system ATP-binding protein
MLRKGELVLESETLFQFDDVTKTYGAVTALNNLSVEVPIGAIGLLGPNGSGKTTMIRTLLGLIPVDRGSGKILGLDFRTRQLEIRRVVGFAPEDECLFPSVIGIQFVAYAGELVGMPSSDALQRAHEVLDYVGLGEARYRKVDSYSTGMKQRIKLASAIVHDPKLLILDEPTNGMDPAGREEILQLSRDLAHNKGMSLLFSSHLLPDVEAVCDYVVVMGSGKVLTQGTIRELKQAHDRKFEVRLKADAAPFASRLSALGCSAELRDDLLYVQIPEGRSPQMLWELAAEERQQIRYLRPQRSTLEEVFLKAVEQP